jgi:hypothetical protein
VLFFYLNNCFSEAGTCNECEKWVCLNFFDGIVPEASKLANPQTKSRLDETNFNNGTSQKTKMLFAQGGFDARLKGLNNRVLFKKFTKYSPGQYTNLIKEATIDGVTNNSSDEPDPL